MSDRELRDVWMHHAASHPHSQVPVNLSRSKNHVLYACFEVLIGAITHVSNSDYKDRNCSAGISSFKTSYFHFLAPQASPCAFPRKVGCHSPPKKTRTSSFKTSAIVRSCRKSPTILFAWAFFALALMCRRSCLPWRPFGLFLRSMR